MIFPQPLYKQLGRLLADVKSKWYTDNKGGYIALIPKELKVKIDNILEVIKNEI